MIIFSVLLYKNTEEIEASYPFTILIIKNEYNSVKICYIYNSVH